MKAQVAALQKELAELRHRSLTVSDGPSGSNSVVLTERVPDFREIREYVTPFDPKLPSCPSAEVWVKGIDETGDVYTWSAAMRLHCARLSLSGCAKLWFAGCHAVIKNWDEFKAEIVKGFPSAKNPIYYHNLLSSRKWKSGETVEEYVYEMLAMGRKGGFTEETIWTKIVCETLRDDDRESVYSARSVRRIALDRQCGRSSNY
ncbi:AAEL007380-PA [Aedes aegypti]|uniref:AAEL007380-PA n=1 Tax=Aedes aegypti TaxID=7159 RepID=Q172J5_AEDAE|nr:AAEL007380-PA [Aedes aegypti]